MGTEGMSCIFREAERMLESWGKKGLQWHGVRLRALAQQPAQAFQLSALGGCAGKKSGPLFKSNSHLQCRK